MRNTQHTCLTYAGLELGHLLVRKGIGFGDDGNQVDLGVQLTHELNIDRFQPGQTMSTVL